MAIHHVQGSEIEKPRFDLDTPQWQLAAHYLNTALRSGTPGDKRNAFRALQKQLPKWAQFIAGIESGCDALQRVCWQSEPQVLAGAKWCICTIASAGYGQQLDDVLTTLTTHGHIDDAQFAVIVIDRAPDVLEIAAKHNALVIHAASKATVNVATKAAIYSVAQVYLQPTFISVSTRTFCAWMRSMICAPKSKAHQVALWARGRSRQRAKATGQKASATWRSITTRRPQTMRPGSMAAQNLPELLALECGCVRW